MGDDGEQDAFGNLIRPSAASERGAAGSDTPRDSVDEIADPGLPRLPDPVPAPSPTVEPVVPVLPPSLPSVVPPSVPESPHDPPDGSSGPGMLPADAMATRNVPRTAPVAHDLGLPSSSSEAATPKPFVPPELEPMGQATTALLVGRGLFVVAALLVGVAARRTTGGGDPDGFWPVVIAAGVMAAVAVAGIVYWAATLADNARRLRARTATPRGMVIAWLAPVVWIVVSSATYLRIGVDGELDPLPGVAAFGWFVTITIAHARLQGVFRGLSRTPPLLWISVYPVDLVAFGLLWWRLTGWPSPVSSDLDAAESTATVAFAVAAALLLNLLLYVWLAQQASNGVHERLGRLEAQHRPPGDEPGPAWFRAGMAGGAPVPAGTSPKRPLIQLGPLATAVSVLHVVWGLTVAGLGLVLGYLAIEYADRPVFLDDRLVVADADVRLVTLVGGAVGLASFAAVVAHGIWGVLSATNGRRVTVHAPNPGTFVIAFAPVPLLVGGGLIVGGRLGYWLVAIGLSLAFFAVIIVNQLLMALSARLGGRLDGFGRWSNLLAVTYLSGVVVNVLFGIAANQLGLYAALSVLQGVLIVAGGVVGLGAMRGLERTLAEHRQLGRAPDV